MKKPVSQKEFISHGFAPELHRSLDEHYLRYTEATRIPLIGFSAPTLNDRKAAVWVGETPNRQGEVPTIAVLATNNRDWRHDPDTCWFVGLTTDEYIEARAAEIDSAYPKRAAQLEAAHIQVYPGVGDEFTDSLAALRLLMRLNPHRNLVASA